VSRTIASTGIAVALLAAALFLTLREPAPRAVGLDPTTASAVVTSYAELMHAAYSDSVEQATRLATQIDVFLAAPSPSGLEAARAAWLAARPAYLQTEVARFYEGPIDGGPNAPERWLNAWPLDEAYIDAVDGAPSAGLVNDPAGFPTIDATSLRAVNERGGEANIATGWHAIEFLLWGQDLVEGPGGGHRSHLDYVVGEGGAANAERRAAYLRTVTSMLIEDLGYLRDQWAAGDPDNYRTWLLATVPRKGVGKILSGMATLASGELRGERLVVPYVTKDRENEHSCFSDATHLDHLNDVIGIRNVWQGHYVSTSGTHDYTGTGVEALAREADPRLAAALDASLDALVTELGNPALQPFETAILGVDEDPGRAAIQRAMKSLATFTHDLFDLSTRLDVPLNTTLPPSR
jgi:putative iron-regulated protein